MCLCSHMDIMKCCGIFRAVVTLPVFSACVWKHLGGASWICTEIHWVRMMRMSWSVRGKILGGVLLWYVIGSIRLQWLDHWWSWCRWPSIASFDKGVLLGGRAEDGRQIWTDREAVGTVCANRLASQYQSSLDTRRCFGRFRRFPEPLRRNFDSDCCFALSLSSLLECCPKFCREWLVGRRLTIFRALNWKSVVCHCGPSCGHGRRILFVGLLWLLQTVLPLMPHTRYQCLGQLWLLWVVQCPWLLFLAGRMCWPTLTANIWEVGTVTSWWIIPPLITVFWNDACRRRLLPSLGL